MNDDSHRRWQNPFTEAYESALETYRSSGLISEIERMSSLNELYGPSIESHAEFIKGSNLPGYMQDIQQLYSEAARELSKTLEAYSGVADNRNIEDIQRIMEESNKIFDSDIWQRQKDITEAFWHQQEQHRQLIEAVRAAAEAVIGPGEASNWPASSALNETLQAIRGEDYIFELFNELSPDEYDDQEPELDTETNNEDASKKEENIDNEDIVKLDREPGAVICLTVVNEELIRFFTKYPDEMRRMTPRRFEELIAELLSGFGYAVELTQQTRDGGADIIAVHNTLIPTYHVIQCKRHKETNKVKLSMVRELKGILSDFKANKGVMVTTSFLTPDAVRYVMQHQWLLEYKDFEKLQEWLHLYLARRRQAS